MATKQQQMKALNLMTIYLVLDMGGRFVAAFTDEEAARKHVLGLPGKFNMYDVTNAEMQVGR